MCANFLSPARRVAFFLHALMCALALQDTSTAAVAAPSSDGTVVARLKYRDQEQDLLHLRVDLSGVKCLDSKGQNFVPLSPLKERLLIINLWSLHCAPCMEEFQRFHNIVRHVQSKDYSIDFLFIADPPEDNPEAAVRAFWKAPPVTLPAVAPCISTNRRLRDSLSFDGVPITLFLDRERVVRHAFIGSIEGRAIASAIERLLAVLPASVASSRRRGLR